MDVYKEMIVLYVLDQNPKIELQGYSKIIAPAKRDTMMILK